jgi:hypothetical protein
MTPGLRPGDEAIRVPRYMPGNLVLKKAAGALGISRRPTSTAIRELGFDWIEFSTRQGATSVTLHISITIESSQRFNPSSGNIAAGRRASGGPDISVFDTGRLRIDAPRQVGRQSLDDPASALAKLSKIAPGLISVGSHAAGAPGVGAALAKAFPTALEGARRLHGSSTDYEIRIARLGVQVAPRSSLFLRIARDDRVIEAPPWSGGYDHQKGQYVFDMLATLRADLHGAVAELVKTSSGWLAEHRLRAHVSASWVSLCARSWQAFLLGMPWSLELRLLGFDDGPAHYVRRVGSGMRP